MSSTVVVQPIVTDMTVEIYPSSPDVESVTVEVTSPNVTTVDVGNTLSKGDKGDTGPAGPAGPEGPKGDTGDPGAGLVAGGETGMFAKKASNADYDTKWEFLTLAEVNAVLTGTVDAHSHDKLVEGGTDAVEAGTNNVQIDRKTLRVLATPDEYTTLEMYTDSDTSFKSPRFAGRRRRETGGTLQSGDTVFTIEAAGFGADNYDYNAGVLACLVDGTPAGNNVPTKWRIICSDDAGAVSNFTFLNTGYIQNPSNINFALWTDITFERLDANGDVGTGANQVAQGEHYHYALTIDGITEQLSVDTDSVDIFTQLNITPDSGVQPKVLTLCNSDASAHTSQIEARRRRATGGTLNNGDTIFAFRPVPYGTAGYVYNKAELASMMDGAPVGSEVPNMWRFLTTDDNGDPHYVYMRADGELYHESDKYLHQGNFGTRFVGQSTETTDVGDISSHLIAWNTERKKDSDFTHSADGRTVTCNFTGEVEVDATVTIDSGNNRVELEAWVNKFTLGEEVLDDVTAWALSGLWSDDGVDACSVTSADATYTSARKTVLTADTDYFFSGALTTSNPDDFQSVFGSAGTICNFRSTGTFAKLVDWNAGATDTVFKCVNKTIGATGAFTDLSVKPITSGGREEGSYAANYAARDSTQNNGSVTLNYWMEVTEGDEIALEIATTTDGAINANLNPNGTRINIKRVG